LNARRTSAESGLPWELQVVSADPLADRARLAGRRRLLLFIATLVAVLLVAGTYFSSRAVARELEVARLQSEFVAAVSHDFRTPLTSLRQVTDALVGDRVAEDRRRDYYDIQKRGIDRLHWLVEGLLDFGRMEAGAREFERCPIAARQWVEEVVRDFQVEVDKQGYTVELAWDGAAAEIEGDGPALTRALWNVLDNAVKYSPDCKTVWVNCRHDAGSDNGAGPPGVRHEAAREAVTISVRDRGLGIEPAERDEIFAKFVRGSAAAASPSSGTGLGLAMVAHTVEAHGGDIEIEGRRGEGTTFMIRLPARPKS
jgi:signal transduction histidine kinase